MDRSLIEIDSAFTEHYKKLLEIQREIKKQLDDYCFDLTKTEITDAIIERMMAFWYFNVNNNKDILDRKINSMASDFFTETCLLFFKCYFERFGLKVFSEKRLEGSLARPDITIWKNEQLIAAIELKVNKGWKNKSMIDHLEKRENQIKEIYPSCFFAVIGFWNFFDQDSKDWNSKYFGILHDRQDKHERTNSSIENLITKISQYYNNSYLIE